MGLEPASPGRLRAERLITKRGGLISGKIHAIKTFPRVASNSRDDPVVREGENIVRIQAGSHGILGTKHLQPIAPVAHVPRASLKLDEIVLPEGNAGFLGGAAMVFKAQSGIAGRGTRACGRGAG